MVVDSVLAHIAVEPSAVRWYDRHTMRVRVAAAAPLLIGSLGCGSSVGPDAGAPRWNSAAFSRSYHLVAVTNFVAELPVAGIAHDGRYYWLAYREEVGGYYDPDKITVARYDSATATRLETFVFDDDFKAASGLAWTGHSLWLNGDGGALTGGGNPHPIAEIDATTGEILRTIAGVGTEQDLAFDGTHLLVSGQFDTVEWIDTSSMQLVKTRTTPFGEGGTQRGIAYRPGEIWLSSQAHDQLAILDDDGTFIGVCDVDILDPGWNYVFDMHMTFVGEKQLAFVDQGRVHVFDVVGAQ